MCALPSRHFFGTSQQRACCVRSSGCGCCSRRCQLTPTIHASTVSNSACLGILGRGFAVFTAAEAAALAPFDVVPLSAWAPAHTLGIALHVCWQPCLLASNSPPPAGFLAPTDATPTRLNRRSQPCVSRLPHPSGSFPALLYACTHFVVRSIGGLGKSLTLCKFMLGYRSALLGFYSSTWLAVFGVSFICCGGCGSAVLVGCRLALLLVC